MSVAHSRSLNSRPKVESGSYVAAHATKRPTSAVVRAVGSPASSSASPIRPQSASMQSSRNKYASPAAEPAISSSDDEDYSIPTFGPFDLSQLSPLASPLPHQSQQLRSTSPSKSGHASASLAALAATAAAEAAANVCRLSEPEIDLLYRARLKDQGLPHEPRRRERFFEIVQRTCKGPTLNLGESTIGAETAGVVSALLSDRNDYRDLDLSNNRLRDSGAEHIAQLLLKNGSLTRLDLRSNDIGPVGGTALLKSVALHPSLRILDLSGSSGSNRNHMGPRSCAALRTCLAQCRSLTVLLLSCNGLGPDGTRLLSEGLAKNQSLQELDISSNSLGAEGASHLARALPFAGSLKRLNLDRNDIGDRGMASLSVALRERSCSLETLDISHNNICKAGFLEVAEMIKKSRTIHTLRSDGNDTGLEGAAALFGSLKSPECSLVSLQLTRASIPHGVSTELAEAIRLNKSLTKIDLSGNYLADEGAKGIGAGLPHNRTLIHLDVSNNRIGDEGAMAIGNSLRPQSIIPSLSASSSSSLSSSSAIANHTLQTLSLRNNSIKTASDALAECLRYHTALLQFDITFNECSYSAHNIIEACLKNNLKAYKSGSADRLQSKIKVLSLEEEALFETRRKMEAEENARRAADKSVKEREAALRRHEEQNKREAAENDAALEAAVAERLRIDEEYAEMAREVTKWKAEAENKVRRLQSRIQHEEAGIQRGEKALLTKQQILNDVRKQDEIDLKPLMEKVIAQQAARDKMAADLAKQSELIESLRSKSAEYELRFPTGLLSRSGSTPSSAAPTPRRDGSMKASNSARR